MNNTLGEMEYRFAKLIWANAPVKSGQLVKLAGDAFGWKKSTTYTMLKRLCMRGLFENDGGEVRVLMLREDYHLQQGEQVLAEGFGGSLPGFLAAFTRRRRLSSKEIEELRQLIEQYEEDEAGGSGDFGTKAD